MSALKSPPLFSHGLDFEAKVILLSALLILFNLIFLTDTPLNCFKRYLDILHWLMIYKNSNSHFPNSQGIIMCSHINMTPSVLKTNKQLPSIVEKELQNIIYYV